jgi:hypothetical protein
MDLLMSHCQQELSQFEKIKNRHIGLKSLLSIRFALIWSHLILSFLITLHLIKKLHLSDYRIILQ